MQKLISLGELIDQSWDTYRERFSELMSVSAWLFISALVSILSLAFIPNATKLQSLIAGAGELTATETIGTILGLLDQIIVSPVLGIWILAALILVINKQVHRKGVNVKTLLLDAWRSFFPLVYVIVLLSLVMMAALAIGIGPTLLIDGLARMRGGQLTTVTMPLVIFGIFVSFVILFQWAVTFSMSPFAVVIENKRGINALKRSRELIRGRFWSFLLRLVIPKLLYTGIWMILWIAGTIFLNLLFATATGLNMDVQLRIDSMATVVLTFVLAVLMNPLIITTDVLLYNSLTETAQTPKKNEREDEKASVRV